MGVHIVVMKRDGGAKDRGRNTMVLHESKLAKQIKEEYQQLVPGIPDEVTINNIAPKLPWAAFHSLASVSHSWLRAIRSHQIFNARVRSKSTQTFVALCQNRNVSNGFSSVVLYCVEDERCYCLPPIAGVKRGIPGFCGCVFLDGKLYILGGTFTKSTWDCVGHLVGHPASARVYVLDLAGLRSWERCASMEDRRRWFGCCAKNEKIYVFGGHSGDWNKPISGSEVYDPKEDTWSPITPMPSFGFGNKVTSVGEELFVHDGQFFQESLSKSNYVQVAEVYNPFKDEWRTVKKYNRKWANKGLMVGEKLYNLSPYGIAVYDKDAGTWSDSQTIRVDPPIPNAISCISPFSGIVVDNEILAFVGYSTINHEGRYVSEKCLIRSQGLGSRNKKHVWQKLQCSMDLGEFELFMCPIQL